MEKMKYSLEGEMSITRAAELRQQLLPLYDQVREIEVDLSGVTEIDSAGLQLMVAMKLESIFRQTQLSFTSHSSAVQEALEITDLVGFLGDPLLITTH